MADKRMFARTITESDAFLSMPTSTQCLYFHLSMNADDDGFINSPKKIMRMIGAVGDDLEILLAKSFIIEFPSGVLVVKHWRINNYLRSDRHRSTPYTEERNLLYIKSDGAYTLDAEKEAFEPGIPMVDQRSTQYSIGENRLEKDLIEYNAPAREEPHELDEEGKKAEAVIMDLRKKWSKNK